MCAHIHIHAASYIYIKAHDIIYFTFHSQFTDQATVCTPVLDPFVLSQVKQDACRQNQIEKCYAQHTEKQ